MQKTINIIMIVTILIFSSCEIGGLKRKTSSHNDTESHNSGRNCMECHTSGGEGEGWFNVAGTVYKEDKTSVNPNKTIELYTEPNGGGELISTIEVDGLGNYYTTNDIDFGNGLYPSVKSDNTNKYMSTKVSTGECSSCHGVTTDRIWIK